MYRRLFARPTSSPLLGYCRKAKRSKAVICCGDLRLDSCCLAWLPRSEFHGTPAHLCSYEQTYRRSIERPEEFWDEIAQQIDWIKPYEQVVDDMESPFAKWWVTFWSARIELETEIDGNVITNNNDNNLLLLRRIPTSFPWRVKNLTRALNSYWGKRRMIAPPRNSFSPSPLPHEIAILFMSYIQNGRAFFTTVSKHREVCWKTRP